MNLLTKEERAEYDHLETELVRARILDLGVAALLSPSTGIIDSHGFMKTLFLRGKSCGAIFAPSSPVSSAEPVKNGWKVKIGGREPTSIDCKVVVNAAGLYAIDFRVTKTFLNCGSFIATRYGSSKEY